MIAYVYVMTDMCVLSSLNLVYTKQNSKLNCYIMFIKGLLPLQSLRLKPKGAFSVGTFGSSVGSTNILQPWQWGC